MAKQQPPYRMTAMAAALTIGRFTHGAGLSGRGIRYSYPSTGCRQISDVSPNTRCMRC